MCGVLTVLLAFQIVGAVLATFSYSWQNSPSSDIDDILTSMAKMCGVKPLKIGMTRTFLRKPRIGQKK